MRHNLSLLWKCLNLKKGHKFGTPMSGLTKVYDEHSLFIEIECSKFHWDDLKNVERFETQPFSIVDL